MEQIRKKMKTLTFEITIKSPHTRVWDVLWMPENYREWTKAFHPSSYYTMDVWEAGSKIQFLTADGHGMYSLVKEFLPHKKVVFQHLGEIENFVELESNREKWGTPLESYEIFEEEMQTKLVVKVDTFPDYEESMNRVFPVALNQLKELAEK